MSANNGEVHYTVDKILRKRFVGDVAEYLVEWHGSDGTQGTDWEPEDNLVSEDPARCEVKKFNRLWEAYLKRMERKRKRKATLAVASASAKIKVEDDNDVFVKPVLPAKKAKPKKPDLSAEVVIKKEKLELQELMVVTEKLSIKDLKGESSPPENSTTTGKARSGRRRRTSKTGLKPEKIIGATEDNAGKTMFVLKWENADTTDLIPVREANVLYPQLVIEFYQDHIAWEKR